MKSIINKNNSVAAYFMLLTLLFSGLLFQSCESDDDEGATPEISYVRVTNPDKSDSLVVRAFLGSTIAIIGNNLQDLEELWFNDQKAILNTSFITSTSVIVTIPDDIPEVVTDSMTLVTHSGIKVKYPFGVDVPPPLVNSMLCEQVADGETAVIYGNFFIDDPNKPLEVYFPGNIKGEVVSVNINEIDVIVPSGTGTGQISVKSLYGMGRSSFFFRDNRNIFLDFDTKTADGGWRSGVYASDGGISGSYVKFSGSIPGDLSDWNEDAFSFNYWPASTSRTDDDGQTLWDGDISEAVLKFEVNVTSAWSANALQMIFTPASVSGTNGYIADGSPRGLWRPWESSGSFITDGWITVSFSLSDFIYTHEGGISSTKFDKSFLGGLTFFVYHGGVEGTECTPTILIDNIRVVPK